MSAPTDIEPADRCAEADGPVAYCQSKYNPEKTNRVVKRARVSYVLENISGNRDDQEVRTEQMESMSEDVNNEADLTGTGQMDLGASMKRMEMTLQEMLYSRWRK